jgi:hypothetical protein
MEVRFLKTCIGNGFAFRSGEVHDLPDAEALSHVGAGLARSYRQARRPTRRTRSTETKDSKTITMNAHKNHSNCHASSVGTINIGRG